MAIFRSTEKKETFVGKNNEHNTFIFREGCGHDTIKSYKGSGDTIRFEGINCYDESFYYEKKGNNLVIYYGNDNSITITNYLKNPDKSPIQNVESEYEYEGNTSTDNFELKDHILVNVVGIVDKKNTLKGTIFDDDIYGGNFNDVLKGGAGYDDYYGGKGNDKIYAGPDESLVYLNKGDGNDVLYSHKEGESDILHFNDTTIDKLHLEKGKYKGLKIVTEHGDSIELANYLKTGKTSVSMIWAGHDEIIEENVDFDEFFAGKKIYQYGDSKNNKLTGTTFADEIHGGKGNDTIKGGNGNDNIYGGQGNDKLYGELGKNNFYFSNGHGQDTITLGKGTDIINFDSTVALDSLKYTKKGNNLIITYGTKNADGKDNTITISNYFKAKDLRTNSVNTVNIAGKTFKLSDVVITGKDGYWTDGLGDRYISKNFYGTSEGDFIYTNNNKVVNYINAGAGHDTMQIESKFTDVYGGDGNDTYTLKSLKNVAYIYDSSGKDTIVLSEKSKDVKILFDVVRDGCAPSVPYDTEEFNGLLVLNKSAYKKALASISDDFELKNGLFVEDYFGNGTIESIKTKDGVITSAEIETVRQNVVSWLESHNYNSAIDALYLCNDKAELQGLINIYNSIS